MFCSKCGKELNDGTAFCPECGTKLENTIQSQQQKTVKVMLDPSEVVPHKETADSSKTMSGQGKTIGLLLMMLSIIADVVCMFLIGFDAFIPVTIGATVLFVIGFFIRMFSP